jgi:type VI protein secretion system component VasK
LRIPFSFETLGRAGVPLNAITRASPRESTMKKMITLGFMAAFALAVPALAEDKAAPPAEHKDEKKDDKKKKDEKKKDGDHKDDHHDDHKDEHKDEHKPH